VVAGVQQHDVDVAKRIELAAPVPAEGDQSQLVFGFSARRVDCRRRRGEDMPQKDVDEVNAAFADLAAAAAGLMLQAQAVFFYFEKFLVNRQDIGRALHPGRGQLRFRVRQKLLQMSGHGDCRSLIGILQCHRAHHRQFKIENRKSNLRSCIVSFRGSYWNIGLWPVRPAGMLPAVVVVVWSQRSPTRLGTQTESLCSGLSCDHSSIAYRFILL
jgi:hypothetical protein